MTGAEKRALMEEAKKLADITGGDMEEYLQLAELGFEELDKSQDYRLIVASYSKEKLGKTHFGLATAPDPIGLINLDLGTEGVVDKFPKKRIIHMKLTTRQERILEGEKYSMDDAAADWLKILNSVRAIVKAKTIRTLVIDSMTDAWEICRLYKHGKLKEVMPHEYSDANEEFKGLANMPYMRPGLNAVYTHKVKKLYKGKNWSGEWERAGFNGMGFITQVNIEHFRVDEDEDEDMPFGVRVIDCRQNSDLVGEELIGTLCKFSALGRVVHPTSKKEDWAD